MMIMQRGGFVRAGGTVLPVDRGAAQPDEPANSRRGAGAVRDPRHALDLRGIADGGVDADRAILERRFQRGDVEK
jgi:hypothetical protein